MSTPRREEEAKILYNTSSPSSTVEASATVTEELDDEDIEVPDSAEGISNNGDSSSVFHHLSRRRLLGSKKSSKMFGSSSSSIAQAMKDCGGEQSDDEDDDDDDDDEHEVTPTRLIFTPPVAPLKSMSANLRHLLIGSTTLESLDNLDALWLGPLFAPTLSMRTIVENLPPTLTTLDLDLSQFAHPQDHPCSTSSSSANDGTSSSLEADLELLMSNITVAHLSLRFRDGDTGVMALAQSLHKHPNLKTLDLRGNRMGDEGAVALAEALEKTVANPELRHVNLAWNMIGSRGAIALAKSLPSTQLELLDLSCNDSVDDDAVHHLCQSLKHNVFLKVLNLFCCSNITEDGAFMLLTCLQHHNYTLERINLRPRDTTSYSSHSAKTVNVLAKIEYWLALNRAGRRLLRGVHPAGNSCCDNMDRPVPTGLWPYILARQNTNSFLYPKAGPDELYFFLRENAELFYN